MTTASRAARPLGVALGAVVLVLVAVYYDWMVDDAYISFVYARNVARGLGFVMNPGERVEGYTNFLWVLLLAAGARLGLDVLWLGKVLGVAAGCATLAAAQSLANTVLGRSDARANFLVPVVLAAYPGFSIWCASGLETPLFALLVTLALVSYCTRRDASTGALLAAATMTRPDGAIWALALVAYEILGRRKDDRRFGWAVWAAAFYAPYYAWRCAYYGWPFPNTFYAKVAVGKSGLANGLAYAWNFLGPGCGLLFAVVALPGVYRSGERRLLWALLLGIDFLYVVLVGGDFFAHHRFFAPLLPLVVALAASGAYAWPAWSSRVAFGVGASVLVLASAVLLGKEYVLAWRASQVNTFLRAFTMQLGSSMAKEMDETENFAAIGIGMLAYYSDRRVTDILGLTDEHIAHESIRVHGALQGHQKSDPEYVLDRRPAFVVLPSANSVTSLAVFTWKPYDDLPAARALRESPRFRREYVLDPQGLYRRRKE